MKSNASSFFITILNKFYFSNSNIENPSPSWIELAFDDLDFIQIIFKQNVAVKNDELEILKPVFSNKIDEIWNLLKQKNGFIKRKIYFTLRFRCLNPKSYKQKLIDLSIELDAFSHVKLYIRDEEADIIPYLLDRKGLILRKLLI